MNGLWLVSVVTHAWVALRLLPGVWTAAGAPSACLLGLLLAISAGLVPLALRRRQGKRTQEQIKRSDLLAWASLTLMGLFSSLFVLTLLRDVVALVLWLSCLWRCSKSHEVIYLRHNLWVSLFWWNLKNLHKVCNSNTCIDILICNMNFTFNI